MWDRRTWESCGPWGERPVGSAPPHRLCSPGNPGGWALAFPSSGPGLPTVPRLQGLRLGCELQARIPASHSQASAAEVNSAKTSSEPGCPCSDHHNHPTAQRQRLCSQRGLWGLGLALSLPGGTPWTRLLTVSGQRPVPCRPGSATDHGSCPLRPALHAAGCASVPSQPGP